MDYDEVVSDRFYKHNGVRTSSKIRKNTYIIKKGL